MSCINCGPLEGGSIITIIEPQSPFCQDCGDDYRCLDKLDSLCVIYHQRDVTLPTKLENLGLPSGSTLEVILEAIDDLIGTQFNIPLTVVDSSSVNLTSSGAAGHTLKADVLVSATAGNTLQVNSDGLYASGASDGKVKVNAGDSLDYLVNQVIGGTDGIVAVSTGVSSGLLQVSPSINMTALIGALASNQLFINAVCAIVQTCLGHCATIASIETSIVNP